MTFFYFYFIFIFILFSYYFIFILFKLISFVLFCLILYCFVFLIYILSYFIVSYYHFIFLSTYVHFYNLPAKASKRRNGDTAVNHMRRESNIGNIILPAQRLSNTAGFIPCFHADSPTSLVFERDSDIR